MKRFEGKVAIVTGAGCVGPGWGNGRATTVRFAEEGARVLAVDRDLDRLAETLECAGEFRDSIRIAQCNVTDAKSIASMVAEAAKTFGRIDVLVNNVGGSAHGGPVEMSEDVFDAQVDHNLKSVFFTCKHVLPIMEKQGAGAIVNVSSTSALRDTAAAVAFLASDDARFITGTEIVVDGGMIARVG